ncbi:response regulator transcription factor [Mesorhizobium sp. 2RAF21]|uniref:helix-turn-helix transcriptional regulator n=1 Tax=Mesorhizobium sp. 2RAF21 TaxID=3232995 RepID=UPI003F9DAAE4
MEATTDGARERWQQAILRANAIEALISRPSEKRTRAAIQAVAAKLGVSLATVYRLMRVLREGGTTETFFERRRGRPRGLRTLEGRCEEIIQDVLQDHGDNPDPLPLSAVLRTIHDRCIATGLKPPHRRTVTARLNDLNSRKSVTASSIDTMERGEITHTGGRYPQAGPPAEDRGTHRAQLGDTGAERKFYPAEIIVFLQREGALDAARRILEEYNGFFLLSFFGPDAFDEMLAGFPDDYAAQFEDLVLARAMQALKHGDVIRARRILSDRFGVTVNDLKEILSKESTSSKELRAFRVLMAIYEDDIFYDGFIEDCFNLISEFPINNHLFRGVCYNALLEFYVRGGRFAEAETMARHAIFHYKRAKSPFLTFCIFLHQSLIRLMMGDVLSARKYSKLAAANLAEVPFKNPNDVRLQSLMDACIEYEAGRVQPLASFLNLEMEGFAHGEIWPSLLEFVLQYGSQALSAHFSTIAARSFIDGWRAYQVSNQQFQTRVDIREAVILQNANRWQEAAEWLDGISRVNRKWVVRAGAGLMYLRDRSEIALALTWLRQMTYESPNLPGLDDLIVAISNNLQLTSRQRISAQIWQAYVAKRQRNQSRARSIMSKTLEECARLGSIAPLAEENVFVCELINNQRIGGFLATSTAAMQVIRRFRDISKVSASGNLTRRETKILLMISEGASNKLAANRLGVSEATVKFHLRNVYRKLGCRNRQEAIGSAKSLGIAT